MLHNGPASIACVCVPQQADRPIIHAQRPQSGSLSHTCMRALCWICERVRALELTPPVVGHSCQLLSAAVCRFRTNTPSAPTRGRPEIFARCSLARRADPRPPNKAQILLASLSCCMGLYSSSGLRIMLKWRLFFSCV